MAALKARWATGSIAITGSTPRTVLTLTAPTNQRVYLEYLEVSFDGTTATNTPVEVIVQRASAGGTLGTTLTPTKLGAGGSETIQTVGKSGVVSVEPTYSSPPQALHEFTLTPNGGTVILPLPFDQKDVIAGAGIIGVLVTAAQNVNVRVTAGTEE